VAVTAGDAAGRLWLEVTDDGPGMAEEQRLAVLVHGVRLDERVPGQGFGLAIVTETAGLYGGRLTLADNAPGLSARLELPAAHGGRSSEVRRRV
jgi:signal transduction histidine kinase